MMPGALPHQRSPGGVPASIRNLLKMSFKEVHCCASSDPHSIAVLVTPGDCHPPVELQRSVRIKWVDDMTMIIPCALHLIQ